MEFRKITSLFHKTSKEYTCPKIAEQSTLEWIVSDLCKWGRNNPADGHFWIISDIVLNVFGIVPKWCGEWYTTLSTGGEQDMMIPVRTLTRTSWAYEERSVIGMVFSVKVFIHLQFWVDRTANTEKDADFMLFHMHSIPQKNSDKPYCSNRTHNFAPESRTLWFLKVIRSLEFAWWIKRPRFTKCLAIHVLAMLKPLRHSTTIQRDSKTRNNTLFFVIFTFCLIATNLRSSLVVQSDATSMPIRTQLC